MRPAAGLRNLQIASPPTVSLCGLEFGVTLFGKEYYNAQLLLHLYKESAAVLANDKWTSRAGESQQRARGHHRQEGPSCAGELHSLSELLFQLRLRVDFVVFCDVCVSSCTRRPGCNPAQVRRRSLDANFSASRPRTAAVLAPGSHAPRGETQQQAKRRAEREELLVWTVLTQTNLSIFSNPRLRRRSSNRRLRDSRRFA